MSILLTACSEEPGQGGAVETLSAQTHPHFRDTSQDRAQLERKWEIANVGQPSSREDFEWSDAPVALEGYGAGAGAAGDSMRFAFRPLLDNGFMVAKVTVDGPMIPEQAGIMIREDLDESGRFAMLSLEADGSVAYHRRTEPAEPPRITRADYPGNSVWFKLVREGEAVIAWYSEDGADWQQLSADTVRMPRLLHAGLAAADANASGAAARFSEIALLDLQLASPGRGQPIVLPANVLLGVETATHGTDVGQVEFFSGAEKIGLALDAPFESEWKQPWAQDHRVIARVTDRHGREVFSEPLLVSLQLPPAAARWLGKDDQRRGNWKGRYGTEGAVIVNMATNLPVWARIAPAEHELFVWSSSRSDIRMLEPLDEGLRIAACWFSPTNFTVNVQILSGRPQHLSVYFLDWEGNRVQDVELADGRTQERLGFHQLTSFRDGVYLRWEVQGHLELRLRSRSQDGNAVVSGIFLD